MYRSQHLKSLIMAKVTRQTSTFVRLLSSKMVAHCLGMAMISCYHFNPQTQWVYFWHGAPLASSAERSRKKRQPKFKKFYHDERKTITACKNRSHREIARMSLLCLCGSGCLMRRPATESFELIRLQRQNFYTKSYNEQNYILHRQIEVKLCASDRRWVTYKVPSIGLVCPGAVKKVYGFSNAKLRSSLEKYKPMVFLLNQTWEEGIEKTQWDFCLKHEGQSQTSSFRNKRVSHTTEERENYFDSNESMRKMWRDFVTENRTFSCKK